jgi:hypothetical protein
MDKLNAPPMLGMLAMLEMLVHTDWPPPKLPPLMLEIHPKNQIQFFSEPAGRTRGFTRPQFSVVICSPSTKIKNKKKTRLSIISCCTNCFVSGKGPEQLQ